MEQKSIGTAIFMSILMLLGLIFFGFFIYVFFMLIGKIYYTSLIITIAVILYCLFLGLVFHFFKTKRKIGFASLSIIAVIVASISPIYHAYVEKIPTVSAEVNIYDYIPFVNGTKAVSLGEEATLQLTDNLPKIDGATALYPLYSAIVQATYPQKDYEPYFSEVMINTTPEAYNNLFSGKVDMIFVAGPSEAQLKKAEQLGLELKMTPIGREAFVFFVNKKNEIEGVTLQQIKDIYSGKVNNWEEVGGSDNDIRAFQRPEDSGSQTALQKIMGDTPIMEAPTEYVVAGMGGIINEVAQYRNYKNAIGYTYRFYSTKMVRNDQIKLLEINDVAPTKENIRNGKYPIASEFYIITAGTDNPNVEKLIEWILSPQGQKLVDEVGYVPVREK